MKPKLGTPQRKLEELLKFKIQIQELDQEQRKAHSEFTILREQIRNRAQKIGEMKKTLFEMI